MGGRRLLLGNGSAWGVGMAKVQWLTSVWWFWAPAGAFGSIWAHVGRAPSGRVRDGLRLSSRFLLHAGRREAQKHDASLGYVRNVDAARVSQGRRYTMFDCGQTVNES